MSETTRNDMAASMQLKFMLNIAVFLGLMTGCSIVEDRSQCPCLLTLDFSQNEKDRLTVVGVNLSDAAGSGVTDFTLDLWQTDGMYTVSVPRSEILVNVSCPSGTVTSTGLMIPVGEDCPRVYMHASRVAALAEEVTDTVVLYKNHCVMDIVMEGDMTFGYVLRVKGGVCGYDLDGSPLTGDFDFSPSEVGEGRYQVVLPRQIDLSLTLEINDGTGVVKKFALGEYVVSSGYDWESPDLQDITVFMDWSMTEISVTVEEWNSKQEHEIII